LPHELKLYSRAPCSFGVRMKFTEEENENSRMKQNKWQHLLEIVEG